MTQEVSHTHIPDFATQVNFAKHYVERGFHIVAVGLSWEQSQKTADALKKEGVEVDGVALDSMVKKNDLFARDTFVLWCEEDPRTIELAKPLMDILRTKAEDSPNSIRIAQNSPVYTSDILAIRKRPGAGM